MSEPLTEAELAEMEERARHRVEPWRPRAREEVRMREDNRKLIKEVRRLSAPEEVIPYTKEQAAERDRLVAEISAAGGAVAWAAAGTKES